MEIKKESAEEKNEKVTLIDNHFDAIALFRPAAYYNTSEGGMTI